VNTSGMPSFAAVQLLILGGILLSWAYLGGLVFAGIMFARARDGLRRMAAWSIAAQLMPAVMGVLLVPVIFLELAIDRSIVPAIVLNALAAIALLAGPAMSLLLIVKTIRRRRANSGGAEARSVFAVKETR
tara:strand:+ start:105 stop:497 length:393 start_codon:yes stop_codon:yes gene_type:complete